MPSELCRRLEANQDEPPFRSNSCLEAARLAHLDVSALVARSQGVVCLV